MCEVGKTVQNVEVDHWHRNACFPTADKRQGEKSRQQPLQLVLLPVCLSFASYRFSCDVHAASSPTAAAGPPSYPPTGFILPALLCVFSLRGVRRRLLSIRCLPAKARTLTLILPCPSAQTNRNRHCLRSHYKREVTLSSPVCPAPFSCPLFAR